MAGEGTTDADGEYFVALDPGDYTVCEVLQAGWVQSAPETGADCSPFNDGAAYGPVGYAISLDNAEIDDGNDFGNWTTGTKSGMKFYDQDHSSAPFTTGDTPLEGWTIQLLQGGVVIASTQTLTDGSYTFLNLAPGDYAVCEVMEIDWTQTFPTSGYSCTNGTYGYSFTLTSGQDEEDNDFGNYIPLNHETAFAQADDPLDVCFIDQDLVDATFSNWGWTNGPISDGYSDTWDVWAGAGGCDTGTADLVGTVMISYIDGHLTTNFSPDLTSFPGLTVTAEHVYAGSDPFPMKDGKWTVSPGQYYIQSPLTGDIYVIYHLVVEY